jgi:hypothetical protein
MRQQPLLWQQDDEGGEGEEMGVGEDSRITE